MVNKGKCYKCRSFLRYYTRGRIQFNITKYGWCGTKLCTVEGQSSVVNLNKEFALRVAG